MEENANKLHFECTDFNSSTRVTVYAECMSLKVGRFLRHSVHRPETAIGRAHTSASHIDIGTHRQSAGTSA